MSRYPKESFPYFSMVLTKFPYEKFKDKWGKPKANPQFMAALEEIEANPGIYMLGEDPRAEKFLHQFYDFKSSSQIDNGGSIHKNSGSHQRRSTRSKSLESHGGSSDTACSTESENQKIEIPSGYRSAKLGSGSSRKYKRHCPRKSETDKLQLSVNNQVAGDCLSDTPSDISSDHSRVNSLDPIAEDSNDDEGISDSTNQRLLSSNFQDEDINCSTKHSLIQLLASHQMTKKAEKKALKKAAKREAKRLERRARKEARRELKRLHKLEKRRLTEQDGLLFDEHKSSTKSYDINQENSNNHVWDDISEQIGKDVIDHWSPAHLSEPILTDEYSNQQIPLGFDQSDDIEFSDHVLFSAYQNDTSYTIGELLPEVDESPISPKEFHDCEPIPGSKRRELSSDTDEGNHGVDDDDDVQSDRTVNLESNDIPAQKRAKAEFDNDCMLEKETTSALNIEFTVKNDLKSNDLQEETKIVETESLCKLSSVTEQHISDSKPQTVSKSTVNRRKFSGQQSRIRKKLISISDSSDENNEVHLEKKLNNSICLSSNDSDLENDTLKNQWINTIKSSDDNDQSCVQTKQIDSISPQSSIIKLNKTVKSKKQKINHTTTKSKVKQKQSEKHSNEVITIHEEKRLSTNSNGIRQTVLSSSSSSSSSNDPFSQLNHCCRDLKTSLIRGHENFIAAVQILTKVRSIPVRLPQLAEAWDLMDCIKKCRRYKLSAEVRDAAQSTFQFFQSLQANATKEELTQAQALIAAHQNRVHASVQDSTADNKLKTETPPTPAQNDRPLQNNTHLNTLQTSTIPSVSTDSVSIQKLSVNEPENLTADLEAKVDDVLSRIRATEERMAAAAAASTRPETPYKSLSSHMINPSTRSSGGRIIRASAVAAATAHMHDEEDEETVMSRVEQVAAFEAATEGNPNTNTIGSPPPPPPPLPPPFHSVTSSDQFESKTSPSVDLDLDSRIQLFMSAAKSKKSSKIPASEVTTTNSTATIQQKAPNITSSPSSNLLPALLAKRKLIADKLAATKAAGSPIKHCHPVTSPLPSPPSSNNEINYSEKVSPSSSELPFSSKVSSSLKSSSKDDELYDLLGV
ncbi:unnamed protein product [Heterobilharzia americana]|nr:unnamed protein product [Heterobilharzia americana]